MRRVFPLRPAETNHLVTYDNGAFEQEPTSPLLPSTSCSVSALLMKRCTRSSACGPPTLLLNESNSSHSSPCRELHDTHAPLQKLPSSLSDCLEFAEVCSSPCITSSPFGSSYFDEGVSTSFDSSNGNNHRNGFCTSSASSSINAFNSQDSAPSAASYTKDVDALLDTASSSFNASETSPNIEKAPCSVSNSFLSQHDTHDSEAKNATANSTTVASHILNPRATAITDPQDLTHPEIPIYVVPKKVEQFIDDCMVVKPQLQSSCTTERRRPHNSTRDNSLTSHTSLGAYRKHTEKSIMHRGEVETCSCSIPLRYIAKYLRTEKGKSTPRKESASQPNSPAKFSTLTNRLFSPQLSPRARLPVNVSTKTQRSVNVTALQGRIVGQDESMVKVVNGLTSSKVGDMDHKEGEEVKHSVECESFGSAMVNDYVQHIQEKPKSLAVRKCCSFASFEYDSDFKISGVSKAHSNRLDPGNRPFQLCSSLSRNISGVTEKLVAAANAVVNQPRSSSMDSLVRLDSESSTCSSKVGDNDLDMDYGSSAELLAVEERNERKLALLKLKIKHLNEEKKLLGRDLAAEMEARHRAQESAKVIVRNMEREMEGKLISAEKNHAYAKACLEQEIDRRKKDWAAKLEKIKVEEKRLRDRVTEMAIERVELQKAIAMYRDREASLQAQARDHELSAQTWMRRHHQSEEEVSRLRKSATNGSSKLGSKENGMEWVWQRSKVLERENAELMKEVSRLRKAYANEELSFENLWQNLIDIMNGPSNSKLQSLRRLYRELKAFAVREEDLRHEIDILQSQLLKIKHKITPEHEMGGRVFSPVGHLRSLASTDKGSELTEQLINKLELTKQHTRHVEHQLEAKEEEVELLHSTLQEREDTINNMQAELTSVKVQRDGLQKQVQLMSQEANRLTQELSELKQVVEKLDDELMLKEGEISILRDNCSESDF